VIPLPGQLTRSLNEGGRDLTVLVIRLGAMGDILRTVPPVRLLRWALPEARVFWVLEDHWKVLLDGHPDLDGVIAAPRRQWEVMAHSPTRWPELLRLVLEYRRRLRAARADLVVDFHGNLRSGLMARWTRAPVRLGFAGHEQKEGNRWFTTHHVPSGERRTPRMERNLSLVRALGLPDGPLPGGALPLVASGEALADEVTASLPRATRGFAVISPGASVKQAYKRPPVSLLAGACRHLASCGVAPLVVYGPGEEDDARSVVEQASGKAIFAPPTRLPTLAALLARARLFLGGDTGPMHMACAVGCPVVSIYGPTDPRINRPWGVSFRVVSPSGREYTGVKRVDREAGGFEGIQLQQVEEAISLILNEGKP
jgi:ADP-heptose:LPS heptosyltransferase